LLKHCWTSSALALGVGCSSAVDGADGPYPEILAEYRDYKSLGSGQEGERMNPFALMDQRGDELDYRQLLGYVTVLDVGAVWCIPCQESASTAQSLQADIGERAWVVQILVQDASSGPPGPEDAQAWAEEFDLELPVLADSLQENLVQWAIFAWPTVFVVAPDGEILTRSDGALTDEEIAGLVADALQTHAGDIRE